MVNYTSNHDDDPSYIRRTAVILKCDENEEGSLTFISTFPNVNEKYTNYTLQLSSKCCCPGACPSEPSGGGGGGHGGLSVGSILLIVFFCLLFVYVVGGFIFLKFVRKAEGIEAIPNYSFWGMLPGLIKDGIVFAVNKCRRNDDSSRYEKI
jgi:hypothetical protein